MKTVLVFAAHPDDEVLGCGGSIAYFKSIGFDVHVVFMTDGVGARGSETSELNSKSLARQKATECAANILGIKSIAFGQFPDNRMDSVDLLDIVQSIEQHITCHQPEIILTHHAWDLNIDHRLVHQAVVTACRPQPGHCVKTLLFFEVASSTEWQLPASANIFAPNWFIDITAFMEVRVRALKAYSEELRDWPHSRSLRALEHLACWRGATVGMEAAEAFMLGRNLQKIG